MNELALFAGAGGGILGGHLLGWRTVCAVEIEDYPRRVLLQRQADRILPRFPIWDDVCTFDGRPWSGKVDVISGGFPCQDISAAGSGAGLAGSRSGLWSEMARIIGEVRPGFVFVENSPMLTIRGLGTVLGDLASLGYNTEYGILGAHHAGAPHKRDRIWILAHSDEVGRNEGTDKPREERETLRRDISSLGSNSSWWGRDPADGATKSGVGRVAHGVAHRVDRLKSLGNGQVPAVAALAWRTLYARIQGNAEIDG